MKICFLPLDSRPCTFLFPQQLAAVRGVQLTAPGLELMDYFKEPSDREKLQDWLETATQDADALVLAVDQLLYGGVVASRTSGRPLAELEDSLAWVERLKEARPGLKIYAFNILMRTTVSTLSKESQRWWEQIARYSQLKYAVLCGAAEREEELSALEQEIPPAVLEEFLEVRGRNHAVNMACVRLTEKGVFQRLLVLQEDCSTAGLQLLEQERICEAIKQGGLEERVFLHNGTDEAGTEMALYAVNAGTPVELDVRWLGNNPGFTAKYEDRPFAENLRSHLQATGIRQSSTADRCLIILPPRSKQGDHCPAWENPDPYTGEAYEAMADEVKRLVDAGRNCYMLDLTYANGGDFTFMETLAQKINLGQLWGYAAWNTASNALGTILAQILACPGENTEDNWRFTAERLGDDLLYQARIRQTLSQLLLERGEDLWCLEWPEKVAPLLEQAVHVHRADFETIFGPEVPAFSIHLPWPRIFEAEVTAIEKQRGH